MDYKDYPIMEYDFESKAVINPSDTVNLTPKMPEHCVLTFYSENLEMLRHREKAVLISTRRSEVGDFPIYKIEFAGKEIAVFIPGLGSSCAAGFFEEIIAMGVNKFVACGSAGVLDKAIERGTVVLVEAALRDEGTSYHYLPPSRLVEADPKVLEKMENVLMRHDVRFLRGKTWTTDAFYRETVNTVSARKREGCITVEMESAALLAVSKFRNVKFGQFLCAGDDVSGNDWDPRYCRAVSSHREKMFWLSVEACLEL